MLLSFPILQTSAPFLLDELTPHQMIFIGEHTSYTHGWISAAVDSGIRGAVQMMLGAYCPRLIRRNM